MYRFVTNYLFTVSVQPRNYVMRSGTYLIQAPPKQPRNSYSLYYTEQYEKSVAEGKTLKITEFSQECGRNWKNLPAEAKRPYVQKSESLRKEYAREKQIYNAKYENPFHNVNYISLGTKELYDNKKIVLSSTTNDKTQRITEYASLVKAERAKMTPAQVQELKKRAEQISKVKNIQREKFKFPQLAHRTIRSFTQAYNVDLTGLGEKQAKTAKENAYKIYLKNWEKQVEEWLKANNYQFTIQDFKRLYNKDLRIRIRESEIASEQREIKNKLKKLQNPKVTPKATKAAAQTTPATQASPAAKQAEPVKKRKPRATRKPLKIKRRAKAFNRSVTEFLVVKTKSTRTVKVKEDTKGSVAAAPSIPKKADIENPVVKKKAKVATKKVQIVSEKKKRGTRITKISRST